MGFWIFMAICNLLIPVIMIIFGHVFLKHPPEKINGIYGYRTSMSRKNQDTWDFAHRYCGKLWWRIGWWMLFISEAAMFVVLGKDDSAVGYWAVMLEGIECVLLIGSILPVELALKRAFDKDGNRRDL